MSIIIQNASDNTKKIIHENIPIYINGDFYEHVKLSYRVKKVKNYEERNGVYRLSGVSYTYTIRKQDRLLRYLNNNIHIKHKYYGIFTTKYKYQEDTIQVIMNISIRMPDNYYNKWLARKRDEKINNLLLD